MTAWRELAGSFAGQVADLPADPRAMAFLEALPASSPILVACSGGADSVFLVLFLLARLPDGPKRLQLAHFNHRLRGAAADADAAFAGDLAGELGLPFHLGNPGTELSPDEASLRKARYDWLEQTAAASGASTICLGHHADDLLETQLMAFFSGSGPAGMAAPQPVKRFPGHPARIRPLLLLRRAQIEDALRAVSIPWREDASNRDRSPTRNRLRHDLIPLLRDWIPQDLLSGAARTAVLMREAVDAMDAELEKASLETGDPDRLDFAPLKGRPRAVLRRAFMGWWMRHRADWTIAPAPLDRILLGLEAGASRAPLSIGRGQVLSLDSKGELRLVRETPSAPEAWEKDISWAPEAGPLFLPTGAVLVSQRIVWEPAEQAPYRQADPRGEAWISPATGPLTVRQWKPGDRYRPLGAPGNRKLQDLFTDAKTDPEQKHRLPVLVDGAGLILWVPGFPPNEAVCLGPGSKSALKLTYHPHSSGFLLEHARLTESKAQ